MLSRGEKVDLIVELTVPMEEVQKRLFMRGRDQDTKEIIEERYAMYEQTKAEIMAYLIGNGAKIVTVDGVGSPDEVYKRVAQAISGVIPK